MAKKAKSEEKKTSAKSNKNNKKTSSGGNKVTKYFRDLRSEFKKVVWPTKKQVVNNTLVVLVTIVIFSIFVGGLDTLMFKGLQLIVSKG
ncbi:MAG TPA: preprotein translocase subunit SecE [Ruminococcus sp.]|nr:preprotein translocase subunit SecE [Ruminococcus sp.]HCR73665.1 preprotein translocase subunit SecE [Ruminococcus sp.]